MEKNIKKAAAIAKQHNVSLRPHVKTHKIPWIAKKQLAEGAAGITVAKVSAAEVMAANGITDIFIAYPIVVKSKMLRVIQLHRHIDITVGVDSLDGARLLNEAAALEGVTLNVRLEVDTGLRRTGVVYEQAVKLAEELIRFKHLHLNGIYTFRGSIVNGLPSLDRRTAGLEEGNLMVALANRMREKGMDIKHVSVGSTPTAEYAAQVKGVTEIRPGTYVFYDRMQQKLGVCALEDCAATVVVSVISIPSPDLVIIDGGSKTFATDVQPGHPPLNLRGFGAILNHPNAILERVTEEHGMIRMEAKHNLKIGDTLHIVPNHICSTVNLHNKVYIKEGNRLEQLDVMARGMVH
jgi:D-serine deaminase-like pyridoxal phosphate-dependent protein